MRMLGSHVGHARYRKKLPAAAGNQIVGYPKIKYYIN
jgi:hypothetical protein